MKTHCTKKDYARFIGFCQKYINDFRVGHWKVKYKFDKKKQNLKLAHCEYNINNSTAKIMLFSDWSPRDKVCKTNLKNTALHEVIHLVLADLTKAATDQAPREVIMDREHEAIRRLCVGLQ